MARNNSSKSGCGAVILIFVGVVVAIQVIGFVLGAVILIVRGAVSDITSSPVKTGIFVSVVFLITAAIIAFLVLRFKANRYAKKTYYDVQKYADKMNDPASLTEYFESRDAMVSILKKLKPTEFLVKSKYRLKPKPSLILAELDAKSDASIMSAISKISAFKKEIIAETGTNTVSLFEQDIIKYSDRLCPENKEVALTCVKMLNSYSEIVGTIAEADRMEGHEFEYWCADLLRKNGFTGVEVTPGSGDQGVDVTAEKGGIRYAVQCKCYSSDLGNTPVQEVNAGKALYKCQIGAVMTNRYFTKGAKDLADATGTLLWDRDKLIEMLETAGK